MMDKIIWACNTCGSKNVEERVWVNCNTGECNIGEADEEDRWCQDCERSCVIVDISEYKTTADV